MIRNFRPVLGAFTLAATVLAGGAQMALAKPYSYECKTVNFGSGGWVPPVILLGFDDETMVASAYDAGIHEAHKAPIPVKMQKISDTRYRFRWDVLLRASGGGKAILDYTVRLNTKRSAFSLSAQLQGYDNNINGSGACKRI